MSLCLMVFYGVALGLWRGPVTVFMKRKTYSDKPSFFCQVAVQGLIKHTVHVGGWEDREMMVSGHWQGEGWRGYYWISPERGRARWQEWLAQQYSVMREEESSVMVFKLSLTGELLPLAPYSPCWRSGVTRPGVLLNSTLVSLGQTTLCG